MKYSKAAIWYLSLATAILAALLMHPASRALVCMDSPLADIQYTGEAVRAGFLHLWNPSYWMGMSAGLTPSPMPLLSLLPAQFVNTSCVFVGAILFGTNLFLLTRRLGLSPVACLFSALAGSFSSHVLTLLFPGHITKILTYGFIPLACLGFLAWLESRKLFHLLLASFGLSLGLLCGELQICFYTGMWFTAWALIWLFWKIKPAQRIKEGLRMGGGLFVLVGFVAIFAAPSVLSSFTQATQTLPVTGGDDEVSNWNFATQYFFPPEEVLSYVTTVQFFGAPEVYWGRDGTPGPLRTTDDFMGLLPLGFAVLGAVVCWKVWQARFFVIMATVSLLASFGKDGLVYALLYQLPTMKAQRNPHRWTFFVAFSVCVLAGYGIDWLYKRLTNPSKKAAQEESFRKTQKLLWIASAMGLVLFVGAWIGTHSTESLASAYYKTSLSGPQREIYLYRTHYMLLSLVRTGIFLALSCSVVALLLSSYHGAPSNSRLRALLWIFLFTITLGDLGYNASRYIYFEDLKPLYFENPIANLLKEDNSVFRVKALAIQQNRYLNDLVSRILPYRKIQLVDPPAVSRQPADWGFFFNYQRDHFVRSESSLDFFNVKYLLAPGPISDPALQLELMTVWNGVYLYKRTHPAPRAWLVSQAVVASNDEAVLAEMFHPARAITNVAVLRERPALVSTIPSIIPLSKLAPVNAAPVPSESSVEILQPAVSNRLEIKTSSTAPTILVLSEKWDTDWKVWVDDVPSRILKANYLMRAVELPAGAHRVRMEYRPSTLLFWLAAISLAAFACWAATRKLLA